MIKNFLITTIRGLRTNPLYSFINIASLSISLAVGLLVLMMLAEQSNYDSFHPERDRIYRVISGRSFAFNQNATVPMPLAGELKEYAEPLEVVQIIRSIGGDVVFENKSIQLTGYFTEPSFFKVFGFELETGNAETALTEPNTIILTADAGRRIFGEVDPLGKVVSISDRGIYPSQFESKLKKPVPYGDFKVTGILKDHSGKSHLQFDMLASLNTATALENQMIRSFPWEDWDNYFTSYTYIKSAETFNESSLQSYLDHLSDLKYTGDEFYKISFELQPLGEITPGKLLNYAPTLRMPRTLYYIFFSLVLFVILISSINYTNITIARSMTRAKEIGVRKVSGSTRKQLIFQFLTESVTLSVISAVVAMILLIAIKPAFLGLNINQYINYDLDENFHFLVYAFIAVLSVGVLAGVFPSYFLSKLKPSAILKTTILLKPGNIPFVRRLSLHKSLIIFQFFFSFIFIVSTILLMKQTRHYFEMDPGFNKENIVTVDLQGHDYGKVSNHFNSYSDIIDVAGSDVVLTVGFPETVYSITYSDGEEKSANFPCINISSNFLDMYGIRLIAGKGFATADEKLNQNSVLINMQGVTKLGFDRPEDAIGATINIGGEKPEFVQIVGVTADFQNCMPLAQSEQLLMRCIADDYQYLNLKLADSPGKTNLDFIATAWKQIDPVHEAKFDPLSDQMKASVSIFEDISTIISFITAVCIFISCFGLLGLVAFITERRIKEVGIRKVLGANTWQLHVMLSRGFVKLIIISSVIASPIALFLNGFWLDRLANKVSFGFDTIFIAMLIIMTIGFITISVQILRLSFINPVKILRDE